MSNKKCINCGVILNSKNVFRFNKRKDYVDKCDNCIDKFQGIDMYE